MKEQRPELQNRLSHILAFLETTVRKQKDRRGNPFSPRLKQYLLKLVSSLSAIPWGKISCRHVFVLFGDPACNRLRTFPNSALPPLESLHPKGNQVLLLKGIGDALLRHRFQVSDWHLSCASYSSLPRV